MSAYKDRERGSWYVSFHYNDWTGKNRRKLKRGFKMKKEATDFEYHFKMDQASNLDMTFRTKILPYFKDTKMRDIKGRDKSNGRIK